jgi:pyrroloquinoline quinone biosynthesis protein D
MTPFDPQSRPKLAPGVRLQLDGASGEPVLLFPEGVLELNATAHEIARRCTGACTIDDMVRDLAAEYDADEATLRSDALECLANLRARNLVVLPA